MPGWNRRSVTVLGVPFDNVTMAEAIDVIEEKIEERGFHQVATANVDFVVNAINDPLLQQMLCACDLIVPDGMPIVWASRLMGARLKERVSGIDLIPRLAELASRRSYGIYLLGATEKSSLRAAEVLRKSFPKLDIVGRDSPPIASLADMDHEGILSRIEQAAPDVLLVAMGHPKQERWLDMHRHRLRVPLCMGVGASLDFLAGEFSRAPIWMQAAGLEWLYRAAQEPRRLAQRYLLDAYGLARHLPAQVAAQALQPRIGTIPTVSADLHGNAVILSINGNVSESLLTEFRGRVNRALEKDCHIVLDLTQAAHLSLDLVGSLVHLARATTHRNRQLWLAGAPAHAARLFRAARVEHHFMSAANVSDALYRIRKAEAQSCVVSARDLSLPDAHDQVELLKTLCRRLVCFSQNTRLALDHSGARSSANH